jgi:hypothetical protein
MRLRTTLFGIIAIALILYSLIQSQNVGAPGMFTTFAIVLIIIIVLSVIRAWLRP